MHANPSDRQMREFGLWAMLAFWGSAIGGIALAIAWGRSRGHSRRPPDDPLIYSLKQQLRKGEISQREYDTRIEALTQRTTPGGGARDK